MAREEYFHPGVGVTGPDHILRGQVIKFAGSESVDDAGRNSQTPQQNGHGGGEVFAVSLFALEKEVGQRIMGHGA